VVSTSMRTPPSPQYQTPPNTRARGAVMLAWLATSTLSSLRMTSLLRVLSVTMTTCPQRNGCARANYRTLLEGGPLLGYLENLGECPRAKGPVINMCETIDTHYYPRGDIVQRERLGICFFRSMLPPTLPGPRQACPFHAQTWGPMRTEV
jgi:hypothetical protein